MSTDEAVKAAEQAMSDAFRTFTGTPVGQVMWNLDMEKTWGIVARAAVEAAVPHLDVPVMDSNPHDHGIEPSTLHAAAAMARRLNRPMLARLRQCAADTSSSWDGRVTIYPPGARGLVALIDCLLRTSTPAEGQPNPDTPAPSGPWVAVLYDNDGCTFSSVDEVPGLEVNISVCREAAAPSDGQIPEVRDLAPGDVLYSEEVFVTDPWAATGMVSTTGMVFGPESLAPARWALARAVAAGLNARLDS